MIESPQGRLEAASASPGWSNRILIAAMAGMLFLTCFPFRFALHAQLPAGASRFLLGKTLGKQSGAFDDFLNVLLFIPIGFGLGEKLVEKGKSRTATFLFVWLSGAVLSYAVEFTQLYIPGRDSGWEDVITNSTGSAVGFLLFLLAGNKLLPVLTGMESTIQSFVTPRRVVLALLIYFSCWFALSAQLQTETRLSNWDPNSRLLIGNESVDKATETWAGKVSKLEIWNRPLSPDTAIALTAAFPSRAPEAAALAAYDFTDAEAPFPDRMSSVPSLAWSPSAPVHGDPGQLVLDGNAWLASMAPAARLVTDLERTNQFAIHLICTPAGVNGSGGQIVSIVSPANLVDLAIGQDDRNLVFWFRNPLFNRRARVSWSVPNVFAAGKPRNILYSYDGSNLSLYIDGRSAPTSPYRLGPGLALARWFGRIKAGEFEGYHYIYYALVFFTAGAVLGVFARNIPRRSWVIWATFLLLLLVPPLLFEFLLIAVSGRFFSAGSLLLSVVLAIGGTLWINADRGAQQRRASDA